MVLMGSLPLFSKSAVIILTETVMSKWSFPEHPHSFTSLGHLLGSVVFLALEILHTLLDFLACFQQLVSVAQTFTDLALARSS